MENNQKKAPVKTLIGLALLIIIVGLIYSYEKGKAVAPAPSAGSQVSANGATTTGTTASTSPLVITATYVSTAHQFTFNYTTDWEQTNIFNTGLYTGAVALIQTNQQAALTAELGSNPNSATIAHAAQDNALFVRIVDDSSINDIVSNLYGSGVVVSNAVIGGKNIAHVVYSKSTDPTNWKGGSTEAYIFRNTLGEAIVVEANYSTPEPPTSGDLKTALNTAINSLTLTAATTQ